MEKSIENIWTDGFARDTELLAPKLDALYKKKSIHVLEKIKRMMRMDNWGLLPFAVFFAYGFWYSGHWDIGLFGASLFIILFFVNRRWIAALEKIDIKSDSFRYLVDFKTVIRKMKHAYTLVMAIGYPLAVIPCYWMYFGEREDFQRLMSEVDAWKIILIVIGLALVLSLMGVFIYWSITKLMYGALLKKLDEFIADIEELRE